MIYFQADHDGDLSEYSSLVGDVRWQSIGGREGGGSLFANGRSAAAYATADLGEIGDDLYVRARYNVALGATCNILRGRTAGGQTSWQLSTTWPRPKSMGLILDLYNDGGGDPHSFTLTPPLTNLGMGWVDVRVKTGSEWGEAQAWLGGDEVLATTRIPPNAAKVTRYMDVGPSVRSAQEIVNLDAIVASDAYTGPVLWTPAKVREWSEHGRTYEVWSVFGEPTGGFHSFCTPDTGYTLERFELVRNCFGRVDLAFADGTVVLTLDAASGSYRRETPISAQRIRFANMSRKARFSACICRRA